MDCIRFSSFFLLQCTVTELETVRGCVSLKKLKSQGKPGEVKSRRKTFKTFVWISSKNSASGYIFKDDMKGFHPYLILASWCQVRHEAKFIVPDCGI
jgi:hypothetical protein